MDDTPDNKASSHIDGAVVTFADASRVKRLEASLHWAKAYAESILGTVREPLLVLDSSLRVVSANASFFQAFQATPETAIGEFVYDLGDGQWDIPDLRRLLEEIVPAQPESKDFRVEHDFPGLGPRILFFNARRIESAEEQPPLILLAIEDVTEREQARRQIESLAVELEKRGQERSAALTRTVDDLEVEVRERLQAEETLREQSRFELLLTELSSEFVNLSSDKVDQQIEDAQRRICECLGLDFSALWQRLEGKPADFALTHVYCLPDSPRPQGLIATEAFPWSLQQVLAGRVVALSSIEAAPAEAARDKEVWRQFGIKASLALPMAIGAGPTISVLSFNTTRAERAWPETIVRRLQLVAQVFANAIARKRTDEALRESEARLQLATEAAGAGLWAMDPDGGSVWASAKTREFFQFEPDQPLTYQDFLERIHPDDRETVDRAVRDAVSAGRGFAVEYRVSRPDGQPRWIAARGSLWGSPGGTLCCMGVSLDITERRQAETELRASEERFRILAESALIGIYVLQDGKFAYVNPAMAHAFGYSVAEMTGMTPRQIVHPDDQAVVDDNIRRRMTGEVPAVNYEVRGRHKDGSTRNVEVYGTTIEMNGRPAIVGTLIDITERRRTVAALEESEGRFRQVAAVAGGFIWEVDAEGLYTYVSPSVERILGYTPAELMGKTHFYDLFVPSVREQLKAAAFQAFADRETCRGFPNPNLDKSGKVVHLETSGCPVLDQAGNLVGYRGADTDVTARKQAEEELQRQQNELARVSRVATMAQLASSIAHELNQPLGAILRNAEAAELYLREPSPDLDELRAIVEDIRKDDHRAGEVIDRMRNMMKRGEIQRCRLDLGEVIVEVVSLVRPDADRRRVRLALAVEPALPPVQGDRVQLQQVLLNLLLNAMEAMDGTPQEARVLAVRARRADTAVEVAVSDNGHGISADRLPRLFEPFFTSKPNGLGMGLPISKGIIEAHGGWLRAENNAAGGATFTFRLPVAEEGDAI